MCLTLNDKFQTFLPLIFSKKKKSYSVYNIVQKQEIVFSNDYL